jgi:hypothetical protein
VPKRTKRVRPAATNGAVNVSKLTERMFADGDKLNDIRLACGHLRRVAQPGPMHLQKFIERVFAIAGVGQEAATADAGAAQS